MLESPRLCCALVVLAILGVSSVHVRAEAPPVRKLTTWEAAAVERAVGGAARRLQAPRCQEILDDFEVEGRRLREALDEWDTTPADYLRLLPFLDGSRHPLCRKGNVALVTEVGVRRVYVCGRVFTERQLREPGLAESMIIHELLHTLGLGENPPSSLEITQRVEARCR